MDVPEPDREIRRAVDFEPPPEKRRVEVKHERSGNAMLAGRGPVPFAVAGSTDVTVTFADIGQPQTITVPSHAINVRTPWGANGHPLPPPVMLSAGVAGS